MHINPPLSSQALEFRTNGDDLMKIEWCKLRVTVNSADSGFISICTPCERRFALPKYSRTTSCILMLLVFDVIDRLINDAWK